MTSQAETDGVRLILLERVRQVTKEGWAAEHDDLAVREQLARAAVCYADPNPRMIGLCVPTGSGGLGHRYVPEAWPFDPRSWKPSDNRIRNLVRAGALIAAEIDRLQRAETS